ncbi:MAG: hypothetical protein ACK4Y5_16635 [Acetobacteraceae bacterium]|jgi:DNA-binding IclR family transcriptional regulator
MIERGERQVAAIVDTLKACRSARLSAPQVAEATGLHLRQIRPMLAEMAAQGLLVAFEPGQESEPRRTGPKAISYGLAKAWGGVA